MANRLASETSPYLRQHADNPVDWWPWSDEAWEQARSLDRPVLLSIGYSACHWCHVMAHESFEDPDIAAVQNELFINIKVDREERPDVDGVYMQAVVAMSGHGGWPMTVFCTPRGVPFFGGTYFPKEERMGMRAFPTVLRAAAAAYRDQRDAVDATGEQLRQALTPPRLRPGGTPTTAQLDAAVRRLVEQTDRRYGGFGGAPKFPHPAALDLMLRSCAVRADATVLTAAEITLDRMARGGVYDQVGGGFHRYSVDAQWTVPHFEKMLYDNAQLAPVYLHAYQLTGDERWRRVAVEILEYVRREMLLDGGGFASAQDADSDGEEGSFFVWTPQQLRDVLGDEDGALAARLYGVVDAGNFEHGTTVLSLPYPLDQVATTLRMDAGELRTRVDSMRERLYAARRTRVPPARDDKVITSWNALMLAAFAEVGAVLEMDDYVQIARRCADFLLAELTRDGTVLRTWRDGGAKIVGFLEDVAFLADSLLTLYEATGEPAYFGHAEKLCGDIVERYLDPTAGFCDTAIDGEPLLVRPHTLDDNAVPAGQSIAAHALLRLSAFTGASRWHDAAMRAVGPLADAVSRSPLSLGNLAWAHQLATVEGREVAIAGSAGADDIAAMLRVVRRRFDPVSVLAWGAPDGVPLLADRPARQGRATAYVCRGFVCDSPVDDPEVLQAQLRGTAAAARSRAEEG